MLSKIEAILISESFFPSLCWAHLSLDDYRPSLPPAMHPDEAAFIEFPLNEID